MNTYTCKHCDFTTNDRNKLGGHTSSHTIRSDKARKNLSLSHLKRNQLLREKELEIYEASPSFCGNCQIKLPYKQRKCRYCSVSCGNKSRTKHKTEDRKDLISSDEYSNGSSSDRRKLALRYYLEKNKKRSARSILEERNNVCSECNIVPIWNNKPLKFHVDHINGINNDNRIENLRLLCPNCHTQTSTYAGRNIQNHGQTLSSSVSDEDLLQAILNGGNIRQGLIAVKMAPKGGNYERCKRLLDKHFETGALYG